MIRSTGTSGSIFSGLPPRSSIASRIAARSTSAGTPVKSCIRTRAGWKGISSLGSALASHLAIVSMWSRRDRLAVLEAQRVLQEDLDRVRKPRDVVLRLERIEPVDLVLGARYLERVPRAEAVTHGSISATRSRRHLVLALLPANDILGDPARRTAGDARRNARAAMGERHPEALEHRRDLDLSAISLDRRDHGLADLRGRARSHPAGELRPDLANMPASRMKPGRTTETPTPLPHSSSRSARPKPRRPNFVAV